MVLDENTHNLLKQPVNLKTADSFPNTTQWVASTEKRHPGKKLIFV
jgi:hypothetical protein